MTYALGRGLADYDQPEVRRIVRESAAQDYRFSSLILGVVNSTAVSEARESFHGHRESSRQGRRGQLME